MLGCDSATAAASTAPAAMNASTTLRFRRSNRRYGPRSISASGRVTGELTPWIVAIEVVAQHRLDEAEPRPGRQPQGRRDRRSTGSTRRGEHRREALPLLTEVF